VLVGVLALAVLVFLFGVKRAWNAAALYAALGHYQRVDFWLEAAHCARERWMFLVFCDQERLIPYEEKSLADDPGHALLLGLVGIFGHADPTKRSVVRVNIGITAIGLLLLAGLFAYARWHVAALIVLAFPGVDGLWAYMSPDVHGALIGLFGFAISLPVALVVTRHRNSRPVMFWTTVALGTGLLTVAVWVREPIGLIGCVTSLLVAAVMTLQGLRRRDWEGARRFAVVTALVVLAFNSTALLLLTRDLAYGLPAGAHNRGHGLSHNLYMGLGWEAGNPWGIKWDDGQAHVDAARIDPSVVYVSPRHYEILRKRYLEIVWSDPAGVAALYAKKIRALLRLRLPPARAVRLGDALFGLGAGLAVGGVLSRLRVIEAGAELRLALILTVPALLCLLQGVLTLPVAMFVFPVIVPLLCIAALEAQVMAAAGGRLIRLAGGRRWRGRGMLETPRRLVSDGEKDRPLG
jgi:hypothetical protein